MQTLSTIGYEAASLDDFIQTLKIAEVAQVIDVRQVPQSRRRGFSKKALSEALTGAGIGYVHFGQLGDPKEGREAARRGELERFREIFLKHLNLPQSIEALGEASALAAGLPSALLCYERDPNGCHRSIVADYAAALGSFKVRHLGVVAGAAKKAHGSGEHSSTHRG